MPPSQTGQLERKASDSMKRLSEKLKRNSDREDSQCQLLPSTYTYMCMAMAHSHHSPPHKQGETPDQLRSHGPEPASRLELAPLWQ